MKMMIQPVKGTRDFYPEAMAVRSWLYQTIREVVQGFGYQEWEAPFLERIDLYAAKSGEELVKEQAFVFQDRGGDEITLRPELTPSLARMVAQQQKSLVFPLHWWSFGPFWRYERPQKGRTREFFQWNTDLIGTNGPEGDAELVSICVAFFERVGLTPQQVSIHVNNRRLMDAQLERLGIAQNLHASVFRLIDRRDKMTPAEWQQYAQENGLSQLQFDGLVDLLANKDLWQESDEMRRFFEILKSSGADAYVRYNPQIIRGLDYYTGTVFEARDEDGGRAILGGGRYDNLVGDVGGDPLSGVGFAMGDVMIGIVLQKYGLLPELAISPAQVMVTVFDAESVPSAFGLANDLRRQGVSVLCYPEPAKLPKQFKYADRIGARIVIVEGPDERDKGVVTVKNLVTRTQEEVARNQIAEKVIQMLA